MTEEIEKKQRSKSSEWIIVTVFVVIFCGGLAAASVFMYRELMVIKHTQTEQYNRHCETNHLLLSTIQWETRRTKLTLFMRDQIVKEWRRIDESVAMQEAFLIAETNLRQCESYGYIDPFLVLAMQKVESSFRKEAISKMGAIGLNQVMPATGALLAGYFGMDYSDTLLRDIRVSTKFAVKLIDLSFSQYGIWELVAACYNGGPWQAYYYENEKPKLSEETAAYVPAVIGMWKEYQKRYQDYEVDEQIRYK
jgi:soluble lytic murein transglycosylase-like protein